MRAAIADVVAGMRQDGHPVSPGEAVDAARAAAAVDLRDRELLRLALEATLAKDVGAQASFARSFARVFAAPRAMALDCGRGGGGGGAGRGDRGRDQSPPREPDEEAGSSGSSRPGDASAEGRRARAAHGAQAAAAERAPIRPIQLGTPGSAHPMASDVARVLHHPRRRGDRSGEESREDPALRDLASALMIAEETRVADEAARRMARLRTALRRRTGPALRGSIDVQRALRANARFGGVPFVLPRRAPRRRPPRLLLLLDVSHSVARAAGLMLLLVGALLERLPDVRVLVFVDRLVDATGPWRRWLRGTVAPVAPPSAGIPRASRAAVRPDPRRRGRPGEGIRAGGRSFSELLASLEDLHPGAPSDYGRALYDLARVARAQRGRTVAWILGDGRSNRFDPCPWALEDAAARLDRVSWFAPEPPERWGTGDSALPSYAAHVHRLYAAHTLEALADALDDAVRRLR